VPTAQLALPLPEDHAEPLGPLSILPGPDLRQWDLIVVNSSAGKDSQALLHWTVTVADLLGVRDRVHVAHATFDEAWPGTAELAQRQAARYGLPCHVVRHPRGSLLARVRQRGRWPDASRRYCTAEFKRNQVDKLITRLARAHPAWGRRQIRALSLLGIRASESPGRAQRGRRMPQVNGIPMRTVQQGRRLVRAVAWPIFWLTTRDVWDTIRAAGTPTHPAYAHGMPRLSCVLCVFAPRNALILAGRLNPDLLARYAAVEREVGHAFRRDLKIAEVLDAVERGS